MKSLTGLAGVAAAAAMLGLPAVARAAADPVMGDWLTVAGAAKVRIAPCAANPALACGTLLWLRDGKDKSGGPKRDLYNPDAALKGRILMGVQLLSDLKRVGPGAWADGQVYAPETGRTARAKVSANPDGTLKVEGCMAVLCQTKTWARAN
jgi:uncharacterized protein (DUF2147 family)